MNTLLNQSLNQQLFIREVETALESEDAFDSNIEILSYDFKGGDIAGRFRDIWNNRIFDYFIEKNRIGYKSSASLDSKDSKNISQCFDGFSAGFSSLIPRFDSSGKRIKRPKCSGISYNCGVSCITLVKTCWINGSGIKVKNPGGSVASIGQGRIDKLRALADKLRLESGSKTWRKYGSADLLTVKSKNLEQGRKQLFEKGLKTATTSRPAKPDQVSGKPTSRIFKNTAGEPITVSYYPDRIEIEASKSSSGSKPIILGMAIAKRIANAIAEHKDRYGTSLDYGSAEPGIGYQHGAPGLDEDDWFQIKINGKGKDGNGRSFDTPKVYFNTGSGYGKKVEGLQGRGSPGSCCCNKN